MKVKYLDFGKVWDNYPVAKEAHNATLSGGRMILQKELEEFEEKLARFVGTKYAVGVNSGTDALFLTLKAMGIGKGDEVITVSNTFVATIQVIEQCGATPILVDVEERTGLMDWYSVQIAVTKKTKLIIPVQLAGDETNTGMVEFCGVPILEDACQAIGATSPNLGCYSFYPAKLLGGIGDGGAVVCNNKHIRDEIVKLRNHYLIGKVDYDENNVYKFGYNSRLDNAYAAFLSVKLDTLPVDILERKKVAERYDMAFRNYPIRLPVKREVYQDYIIGVEKRDELHEFLKEKGIETLGADQHPPHLFNGLGLDHFNLPITERIFKESLRIPCNQFLTDKEVEYIISNIKEFYAMP